MKVELLSLTLKNFKGEKERTVILNGSSAIISGGNGVGKTTIFEAVMYGFFDKQVDGTNLDIWPRDPQTGLPIPGVEPSVELFVSFDGEKHTIKRTTKEKFTGKGSNKKMNGYYQELEWDNVSLTLTSFKAKLQEYFDMNNAFIISSLSFFLNLKVAARRKILTELSDIPTDSEICDLAGVPNVKNILAASSDLENVKKSKKNTYSKTEALIKANKEQIKAKKEELTDRVDRVQLQKEADEIYNQIKVEIGKKTASKDESVNNAIIELQNKNNQLHTKAVNDYNTALSNHNIKVSKVKSNLWDLDSKIEQKTKTIAAKEKEVKDLTTRINNFDTRKAVLKKRFDETEAAAKEIEVKEICEYCGGPIPLEKQEEEKNKRIMELVDECKEINESLKEEQSICNSNIGKAEALKEEILSLEEGRSKLINNKDSLKCEIQELSQNKPRRDTSYLVESQKNDNKIKELRDGVQDVDYTEIDNRISELEAEHKTKISLIENEKRNEHIQVNIEDLKAKNKEASDQLAELLDEIDSIQTFVDYKINLVEEDIRSFFNGTSFKMFEKNLSNDDYKSICNAYYNGLEFDTALNAANKYNCQIDIIRGLSKKMNLYMPLFKDDCNNVNKLEPFEETQEVTLKVTDEKTLNITLL